MQWHKKLSGLLALQLALVVGIYAWNLEGQQQSPSEPLLASGIDSVNRVLIEGDDSQLTLKKHQGQWQLPDHHNYPVAAKRLSELLDSLSKTQLNWPVVQQASSHERFQVSADNFERRLTLFNGEQRVADVYLGDSPGYRKVYLRRVDDDAVYQVELNRYDVTVKHNDWLDKSLLKVADLAEIKTESLHLKKDQDKWQLEFLEQVSDSEASDSEARGLDQAKADALAKRLQDLQVLVEIPLENAPEKAVASLEVKRQSDDRSYRYSLYEDAGKKLIKRDDRPGFFTLPVSDFNALVELNAESLAPEQSLASDSEAADSNDNSES